MRKCFWIFCLIGLWLGSAAAETISPTTGMILKGARTTPVAVSINHWAGVQQWGLQEADVLYETLLSNANGGQTRLIALYHDALAEGRQVYAGPVRSVRLAHVSVSQEWDAALAFTGTVAGKENAAPGLRGMGERLLPLISAKMRAFAIRTAQQEGRRVKAPNHMTADVTGLHSLVKQDSAPLQGWTFGTQPPGGEKAEVVALDWGDRKLSCRFEWQDGVYKRFWGKEPHMTFHSHEGWEQSQLAFANVIIQRVEYEWPDGNGWLPIAQLTGSGNAVVFTQGRVIEATWERLNPHAPTVFRDPSGAAVQLAPGKTCIAHFPLGSKGLQWQ